MYIDPMMSPHMRPAEIPPRSSAQSQPESVAGPERQLPAEEPAKEAPKEAPAKEPETKSPVHVQPPRPQPRSPARPENKHESWEGGKKPFPKKKRPGNASSVLIKRVPDELNNMETIVSYFKQYRGRDEHGARRFGEIVNVSVDKNRKTALIRYVGQEGAMAAKASTEPILNNPGIRLSYDAPQTPPIRPQSQLQQQQEKRPNTPVLEPQMKVRTQRDDRC